MVNKIYNIHLISAKKMDRLMIVDETYIVPMNT